MDPEQEMRRIFEGSFQNPSSIPSGRMGRERWELEVFEQSLAMSLFAVNEAGFLEPDKIYPQFRLEGAKDFPPDILNKIYSHEAQHPRVFMEGQGKSEERRRTFYRNLSRQMRGSGKYNLIGQLVSNAESFGPAAPPIVDALWRVGLMTIYLLAGEGNKFLVGTKGGIFWKEVDIPNNKTDSTATPLFYAAGCYIHPMMVIGKTEQTIVPKNLIPAEQVAMVRFPQDLPEIEDSLEDAFFHPSFSVQFKGADVIVREGGDIERVVLQERGRLLLAKVITRMGEAPVCLNLSNATSIDPQTSLEATILNRAAGSSKLGKLVACIYRDLVVEEKIPSLSSNRQGVKKEVKPSEMGASKREGIYIPRRRYLLEEQGETRSVYQGPKRPIYPHGVSDYKRLGNMSKGQRQKYEEWARLMGFEEIPPIPEGLIWVRPHVWPREAEETLLEIAKLPVFIQTRIRKKLVSFKEKNKI